MRSISLLIIAIPYIGSVSFLGSFFLKPSVKVIFIFACQLPPAPTGPTAILRGTWFKDPGGPNCSPIDDDLMVGQLESAHVLLSRRLSDPESMHSDSVSPKLDTDDEVGAETTSSITSIFSASSKPACKFLIQCCFLLCQVSYQSTHISMGCFMHTRASTCSHKSQRHLFSHRTHSLFVDWVLLLYRLKSPR